MCGEGLGGVDVVAVFGDVAFAHEGEGGGVPGGSHEFGGGEEGHEFLVGGAAVGGADLAGDGEAVVDPAEEVEGEVFPDAVFVYYGGFGLLVGVDGEPDFVSRVGVCSCEHEVYFIVMFGCGGADIF